MRAQTLSAVRARGRRRREPPTETAALLASIGDERPLERLGEPIDLLLVDGPPSGEPGRERSRYPALPALEARLAPGAAVVLDDAGRPGERWVLERWEAAYGIRFERLSDGLAMGRVGATIVKAPALNRRPGRACEPKGVKLNPNNPSN